MTDTDDTEVFVIGWKYRDESGHGIVRAYDDIDLAKRDLDMLNEACDGSRVFEIINCPLLSY